MVAFILVCAYQTAVAQQRVNEFHSEKFLKSLQGATTFAGRKYANSDTSSPKRLRLMACISIATQAGRKEARDLH